MDPEKIKWLDSRVYTRYVKDGFISQAEVDSHLKNLPDDGANAEWVTYDLEETELTEDADGTSHSSDSNP